MVKKNFITYYGEYSLRHWIRMILQEEITLPDFQRYFVWDPKRIVKLMDSFDKGLFVPPILIAKFSDNNTNGIANYVLDGQQRLSAILLAYLKLFPNKFETKEIIENDNDSSDIDDEEAEIGYCWDFRKIQKIYKQKCNNDIQTLAIELQNTNKYVAIDEQLVKKYNDTNKEDIDLFNRLKIDGDFLDNNFLGYSYIKSINPNSAAEKHAFANIFKNINSSSVKLNHDESRAALYWISGEKKLFFQPKFAQNININKDKIDFTKYMALLSNAYTLESSEIPYNEIARGFARKRRFEDYILDYVDSVIKDNKSSIFGKFSNIFKNYQDDFKNIDNIFNQNIIVKAYSNTVTADLNLFGMFYWVLFKKQNLNLRQSIIDEISEKEEEHREAYQNKNLGRIGAIRERIRLSIEIYKKYLESNNDN